MEKRKALGRGLEALIPTLAIEKELQAVVNINVNEIKPNRFQPRQNFIPQMMQELKDSIHEKGFIQPILVRHSAEGYELVAGERRWRAAKELGITQVPAIIRDIKNDADLLEIALIENLQREELNSIEEAHAFKHLGEEFGLGNGRIAQIVGKQEISVINTLRLLKLPKKVQDMISQGFLSEGHGRAILSLEGAEAQVSFGEYIIKHGLSVREAENQSKKNRPKKAQQISSRATKKDAQLVAWEEELQRSLGTKVRIIHHRERGKIEMEYYSLRDLERLIGTLLKAK
ncbi:MAG: ParB/RepB/Spo0J family partition protein [Candidatus Omnitrophica bacterium]|nr:ParB/RepB/Spo0J family partition protein [Candidatus Omnitrophota bacterium]